MNGFSINKAVTRLTVWHFDQRGQLISTAKYRYDSRTVRGPKMNRRQRHGMFAEFLGHNGIKPPAFEPGKKGAK